MCKRACVHKAPLPASLATGLSVQLFSRNLSDATALVWPTLTSCLLRMQLYLNCALLSVLDGQRRC